LKNLLLTCALITFALSGCASWAEVPKAVDPVAQHALPLAGETLIELSDVFYALCGQAGEDRSEPCLKAQDALNRAVKIYNEMNDPFLEGQ